MSPTARVKERIAELTRPTGEEDLMAVDDPKPRFSLSTAAAVAAAGLAFLGCLLWWAVSSLGQGSGQADFAALAEDSAPSGSAGASSTDDAHSTDDAAATSPGSEQKSPKHAAVTGTVDAGAHSADDIVVSVVGLVQNPGIMTLPDGSRAADALAVAGVLPVMASSWWSWAQMIRRRRSRGAEPVAPAVVPVMPVLGRGRVRGRFR